MSRTPGCRSTRRRSSTPTCRPRCGSPARRASARIGLWREPVAEVGLATAAAMVADSGLRVSSLCRGGFFTAADPALRRIALDENRRAIDETAALARRGAAAPRPCSSSSPAGCPTATGTSPAPVPGPRDAVGALVDDAAAAGVVLAIEPMHPIYAADRGVISTLRPGARRRRAVPRRDRRRRRRHLPRLVGSAARRADRPRRPGMAGSRAYQVVRLDHPAAAGRAARARDDGRGPHRLPRRSRGSSTDAGYTGDIEVEIFNQAIWDADPLAVARRTTRAFAASVGL